MNGTMISNDVDFMIKGIVNFKLFGQELWITSTHIGLLIMCLLIILLAALARKAMLNPSDVPGTFQNILELGVEMLQKMLSEGMGKNGSRFVNYIGSLFLFILFCNLSGLLGLRAPTADFGVTFALGIFTFLIVNYQGIKNRRFRHFTSLFEPFPVLFPINLIGEIANPISLSLRLFGNLLSGVVILGLWYGMMPVLLRLGIPAFLHLYLDLFAGCIQTYVFCMLTMVYINDKME